MSSQWRLWIVSILLAILFVGSLARLSSAPLASQLRELESWVQDLGEWGPIVYGLIYAVAVVALVPASALTMGAGAVFGLGVGTLTASLASITGASLAFLIARYLARDLVARRLGRDPRFAAIDKAVARNGWVIVGLLRLSPAVPFNVQNYLYGVTGIGFWTHLATSWVAMLPGTVLYVYLGHVGRAGLDAVAGGSTRGRSLAEWALLSVGLVATLAFTILVTHLARRAMHAESYAPRGSEEDTSDLL
jgi:uncharacterized membrane protein YdjX (TVP38/TMEM64 family)